MFDEQHYNLIMPRLVSPMQWGGIRLVNSIYIGAF
jgi:hypothetical protein